MTPEQQKKELLESLDRAYSSLAREVGLDRADEEADRFRNALRRLVEKFYGLQKDAKALLAPWAGPSTDEFMQIMAWKEFVREVSKNFDPFKDEQ